jgi:prophage regulatory protein
VTTVSPSSPVAEKLLRLPAVEARTSIRKSQIYAGVKAKTFPAPIKLSTRAVAWTESSISNWINERIRAGARHEQ